MFAPALAGTICGMNFDHMPKLNWAYGDPSAVAAVALMGFGL
ncbi:hypothetical protein [Cryobacterium lactosi]